MLDMQGRLCGTGWHMGQPAACLFSPPSTCSPQLDWFPGPCLPGEWGLLLPFSQPPSPQTGFLIFKPAWAIERACIIQKGLKREREREGGLLRRERRGLWGREKSKHQRWEWKTLQTGEGAGGGQRNIITKNSNRVLQAEPFRRLIIAPLQIWIYHQIIPCLFCKINVNKR